MDPRFVISSTVKAFATPAERNAYADGLNAGGAALCQTFQDWEVHVEDDLVGQFDGTGKPYLACLIYTNEST